ncbi:MAG: ATP-binding cassette domain-containing protein [Erysipelotrichaceae bacterium]
MDKNRLKLENVGKTFRNQHVLEGINCEFESGNIYGIVGENGCGKTVLLKLLCGLMKTSTGQVQYNGKILKDEIDFLPSLGVIIENPGFFDELSGFDNLKVLASFQKKISNKEINESIEKVGLINNKKKVQNYSLGMRQRLGIAQAIMEDPDILILDEFTTALDIDGVEMTHNLLRKFRDEGKIIIITSHSAHDIRSLCDRVLTIRNMGLFDGN